MTTDPGFPVTITGSDGGHLRIEPGSFEGEYGKVWIRTGPKGVSLDAAQREELARALVAASHAAGREAAPDGVR